MPAKDEIVWVDDIERQARELCESEHDCHGWEDHDCDDWLTYPEAERQRARQTIASRLGD